MATSCSCVTQISREVGCEEIGRYKVIRDGLSQWEKIWLMEDNVGKCEVGHFDRKNKEEADYLNGERLQSSEVQRDLGVIEISISELDS